MPYFVTFAAFGAGEQPTATRAWELSDALAHGCRLIDEGRRGVALRDTQFRALN